MSHITIQGGGLLMVLVKCGQDKPKKPLASRMIKLYSLMILQIFRKGFMLYFKFFNALIFEGNKLRYKIPS